MKRVNSSRLLSGAIAVLSILPGAAPLQASGPQGGYQTVTVEVRPLGGVASVGGTVVPFEEITLTAQVPGRVESLAGGEGTFVERGGILVKVDEEELRAQRLAAVAQIRNAEAAVRNAGVQLHRERENPTQSQGSMMDQFMPVNPMKGFMGGADQQVDRRANLYSRGTQVEQAQANLMSARSRLNEIDAKLKDTRSIAPFDGYITHKHVNKGDTVQPGQPLLNFANMTYLQVQADVPARLASGLQPGGFVEVRLDDAQKSRLRARVAQVFPMADATRHTVRVKFDLPTTIRPKAGLYAEVFLPEPGNMGGAMPVIPASAVVDRGGLPMVYVMGPDGKPHLHLLRLGEEVGGQVTVLTGLRGGEEIVVNP